MWKNDFNNLIAANVPHLLSAYPCPIRYDVEEREYVSAIHPCAHLHIWIDTNIRIPINKVIKPLTFVDFVKKTHIKKNGILNIWRIKILEIMYIL